MQHSFIDKYHHLESILHRLDPRVRLGLFLLIILAAITTPALSFFQLLELSLLVAILIAVSKIPLVFILKRTLVALPFLLMIALMAPFLKVTSPTIVLDLKVAQFSVDARLLVLVTLFLKLLISVISMILLLNCGRFTDLLKALQKLKLSSTIISILMFIYRYVFVIIDQFQRMLIARKSRTFEGSRRNYRGLTEIVGTGFIRTYERGERVYASMLSRGFDGTIRSMTEFRLTSLDRRVGLAMITIICLIKFAQ